MPLSGRTKTCRRAPSPSVTRPSARRGRRRAPAPRPPPPPVLAGGVVVPEQRLELAAVVLEARRADEGLHSVLREVEPGRRLTERGRERRRVGLPPLACEGLGLPELHLEVDLAHVCAELLAGAEAPGEERFRLGEAPRLRE